MSRSITLASFGRRLCFLVLCAVAVVAAGGLPAANAAAPPEVAAAPAGTGVIEGVVRDGRGAIVADAQIFLRDLRRRTGVAEDGGFRVESVPPGEYLVEISSRRSGSGFETVRVVAGEIVRLEVRLDPLVHHERIVVTAGEARGLAEVAQPIAVLGGDELAAHMQLTLGETLASQPGVTATYFGPGASRPIIRGLGGDRVRVLEGGVGTGDVSASSPDHAVASNPLTAERIEILRGPATLLYGSSAIGGVVNILDGRIPEAVPVASLAGEVELRLGSAAEERTGAVTLDGGAGRFAWHLDAFRRDTEDLEIPGFAERPDLHEEGGEEDDEAAEEEDAAFGVLPNSATESKGATAGFSLVGDRGFLGVSVTGYDSLYGVPGHAHGEEEGDAHGGEEEEEEEEDVRVDLEQRRLDLHGEMRFAGGPFEGVRLRVGRSDYEHVELEGQEVGTTFSSDAWEARLEAPHRPLGTLEAVRGTVGVQLARRDLVAVGEEAFLPPTVTDSQALFVFEELTTGALRWQLGLRWEQQDVEAAESLGRRDREHDGVSSSLGLVWLREEAWSVGASLARSTKLPNAEELFSNGPHVATRSFEVGDPDLESEVGLGLDVTLRKLGGRVRGELTLFATRFDDFIFERPTDEEIDGLPVLRYVQQDAEMRGAELHVDIELLHREPWHLDLELLADVVRAELADSGEPLPRIPALRWGAGLRWGTERWWTHAEVRRVDAQDRVAANESPSEGYTLVNAGVGYRLVAAATVHDIVLRASNLTDEEARPHTSFLKDLAPLPGRDILLSYRLGF